MITDERLFKESCEGCEFLMFRPNIKEEFKPCSAFCNFRRHYVDHTSDKCKNYKIRVVKIGAVFLDGFGDKVKITKNDVRGRFCLEGVIKPNNSKMSFSYNYTLDGVPVDTGYRYYLDMGEKVYE